MSIFKLVVVALNLCLLGLVAFLFTSKGSPKGDDVLLAILLVATPVATLCYLFNLGRDLRNAPSLVALEIEVRKAKLQNELKSLQDGEAK